MTDYLLHHNANTHWEYPSSAETDALLLAARGAMADFFNCTASEVAFGNNMTTLTYHVSRALGMTWGTGDEIVVTDLDHHANIAPWMRLAHERGVRVRHVKADLATGELDRASLEGAVTARTRLVAIGAASNAIGTINAVADVVQLARQVGALSYVDAVHYAPHTLVDVQALGCDFLACSPYKFYGPHTGALFGRRELLNALDIPRLDPAPSADGERLETGTQNHEGIIGAGAAVEFLASIGEGPPAGHASNRRSPSCTYARTHCSPACGTASARCRA